MKNTILRCYIVVLLFAPFFLAMLLYAMPQHKVNSNQLLVLAAFSVIGWIAGLIALTLLPKKSKTEVSRQSSVGYYGDEHVLMIGNEIINL